TATEAGGLLAAVKKSPPTTRLPWNCPRAVTCPPATPGPNWDHEVPFQRARAAAGVPPAWVKSPPTRSSPFQLIMTLTASLVPPPTGTMLVPFHAVMPGPGPEKVPIDPPM